MTLRGIPLMVLALIIYNALVWSTSTPPQDLLYGTWVQDAASNSVVLKGLGTSIPLPSGIVNLHLGDLLLAFGLVCMAFEMVKATYTRGFGLTDRLLSPLLFVLFLVEFLLVPKAATSVFFLLTVMAGFDVVVGEVVAIRAARRDITFGGN